MACLERTHISSYETGRWFGPSWALTLDQRLELDSNGAAFAAADGGGRRLPNRISQECSRSMGPYRVATA
jgi:hypothetical protein